MARTPSPAREARALPGISAAFASFAFTGIQFCCDLKAWTFEIAVPREKFFWNLVGRARRARRTASAVRPYLENDDGIPDAHEVFHARGVPVGQANTAVARSAANRLRIIRAVNTDSRFVQAHP